MSNHFPALDWKGPCHEIFTKKRFVFLGGVSGTCTKFLPVSSIIRIFITRDWYEQQIIWCPYQHNSSEQFVAGIVTMETSLSSLKKPMSCSRLYCQARLYRSIIVPNVCWRTFRYWAIRAKVTDVWGIGLSPVGGHWMIPSTDFNLQTQENPQHTICKPASIPLPNATSPGN